MLRTLVSAGKCRKRPQSGCADLVQFTGAVAAAGGARSGRSWREGASIEVQHFADSLCEQQKARTGGLARLHR